MLFLILSPFECFISEYKHLFQRGIQGDFEDNLFLTLSGLVPIEAIGTDRSIGEINLTASDPDGYRGCQRLKTIRPQSNV